MQIPYISSHLVKPSWNSFTEHCDAKKQEVASFTIFVDVCLSSHKTLTNTLKFFNQSLKNQKETERKKSKKKIELQGLQGLNKA